MFSDRRATFRSDDIVEQEANLVRQWARLTNQVRFNVVHLIEGALRRNLLFSFDIAFDDPKLSRIEAFVDFPRSGSRVTLNVRPTVWKLAEANHDRSRFILAHEIGHLMMHHHDALGFSDLIHSVLASLQEQERVEPQADKFADRLLVKESMIVGFDCAEDVADFFNVPLECAQRRFDLVIDKQRRRRSQHSGEACSKCANFTLVRNGTSLKCDTCGSATRCF